MENLGSRARSLANNRIQRKMQEQEQDLDHTSQPASPADRLIFAAFFFGSTVQNREGRIREEAGRQAMVACFPFLVLLALQRCSIILRRKKREQNN
jgi:hypothetical protein